MGDRQLRVIGLAGLPELRAGDDLAALLGACLRRQRLRLAAGDVLVVAQKAISKIEGRVVRLAAIEPSPRARAWARRHGKDARAIELVLREAKRLVRMERGVIIAETRQGFVCANAGVDLSNAPPGAAILLPLDADRSARRLRRQLAKRWGIRPAVLISDSFGRPWREGQVNVALGVAGLAPLRDYRGRRDASGRRLEATQMATADALAGAAELVMGKLAGIPAALIRGLAPDRKTGGVRLLLRPRARDLFR